MYVGAFSGSGNLIPLTPNGIRGKTMHHSAIYNPDRNEYFVAWDVDTNIDGKPDRLYGLRLSPNGAIVGRNVLDMTVNVRSGKYDIQRVSKFCALFVWLLWKSCSFYSSVCMQCTGQVST